MKKIKDRRTFLKNVALSTLGAGLISRNVVQSRPIGPRNMALDCNATTLDFFGQGPFYTANPPVMENNQLAAMNEPGQRMIITGRVLNLDCNEYIPDTIIDVWHANDAGQYDNSGFNLRGITHTNSEGFYLYETVKPGKYLNGNQFRPSHIHYKITPPGFPELTTQLYFEGDTDIPNDAAASITSGMFDATDRIIPLTVNEDGVLEGNFDISLDGEGITVGLENLHINKGMIYQVSPNPFSDEVEIHYGVFQRARVGLVVFDLNGRLVAQLEDQVMSPAKYHATWRPTGNLPAGHYFVALKFNALQVHYQKMIKK